MSVTNINVRVDPALKELLKKVGGARGENISNFVRRAILKELAHLSFLDEEQKKALGLSPISPKSIREGKHP